MKYTELKAGDKFKFALNEVKSYIKIEPIEDKWGNVFVAVETNLGGVLEIEDFSPEDEVFKL